MFSKSRHQNGARTVRSLSEHYRQCQIRGKCCGQQQGRSLRGWYLTNQYVTSSKKGWGSKYRCPGHILTDGGLERVSGSEHSTTNINSVETLEHHAEDGAAQHIFDEAREERLVL